jgi:N-methylhydantoinase B
MMDAVALAVFRHALEEVAEEMNAALMRAAYSTNITDRRDSSCAVYLPRGEAVAQSQSGTPLHLGVMPAVLRTILARVPPESMKPGDQYLMNTPYPEGPGHLNDLTLARPVFRGSELAALVANQAHHVDVGGKSPGSMPADSTEIFQEGLQIPPVALIKEGAIVDDVLSIFLANIRTPSVSRGDLLAQAAANNVGAQRVNALFDRFGDEAVPLAMEALLDHAEERMRALINTLPDGRYSAHDSLEGPDGPLRISVEVQIAGSTIIADFSGTDAQTLSPLNCRLATVKACLAYVAAAMLDPGTAPNAGALRPLTVIAPEGSLLNASYPSSLVHSNVVTSQRICDVLIRALYQTAPHLAIAACSGTQNLVCLGGFDERRGEPFTYIETHGGGSGATATRDGESGVHTHMTNTLNSPVEVLEHDFPFRVVEYALEPDSAGSGYRRGGFGIRKSLRVDVPATLTVAADRIRTRPWGLEGGEDAAAASLVLVRDDEAAPLPGRGTFRLAAGDMLTLVTPGGGGWGHASAREEVLSAADFDAGLVTDPHPHPTKPST